MKNLGSLFYKPKPKTTDSKPKRWNPLRIIGKALKRTCTAIGAMVLISITLSIILLVGMEGKGAPPLPDEMVLVFKIDGDVSELQTKPSLLEPFPFAQPTIRNVVDTLDKAKDDTRVKGLVVSLKSSTMSVAHIQELRMAIERFKKSGKFAKVYSSSYDDPTGGLSQYYFVSVFDEIWMQPVGLLSISGPNMEMPFAREALDSLGVQPQFLKREKYKGVMENFSASEMSAESEEMWNAILGNLSTRMMADISQNRSMNMVELGQYVDKGILTGNEALQAKLVDRLDYADVMVSEIRQELKGDPNDKSLELVLLGRYAQGKKSSASTSKVQNSKPKNKVALIYVVGSIVDTAGPQGTAGADKISSAITTAYEDKSIEAIILRVDSPGGSPTASETIRRALVKAQEKGKKVVVSMGPVAASGGYWVATHADRIVASPGTITGSIGVVMGKFEASELWQKIGVNWEGPQVGANAEIWSINQPFDESERERLNVLIDDMYDAFLSRVAEGRDMPKDKVRSVAQGRAWTGEQAKMNGLVDMLGGLDVAKDEAARLLGKESREDLQVILMPKELNKLEQLVELFSPQVSIGKMFGLDSQFVKQMQAYLRQAELSQNATNSSVYQAELEMFR